MCLGKIGNEIERERFVRIALTHHHQWYLLMASFYVFLKPRQETESYQTPMTLCLRNSKVDEHMLYH